MSIEQLQADLARVTAERDRKVEENASLLRLIADCRFAVGDDGKRMQDEFVGYLRGLKAERDATKMVPQVWHEVLRECAEDLAIELDQRYGESRKYPSEQRKYEGEMQPVYRARALLQSAPQATTPDLPREVHLGKGEFVIWPVKIDGVHGLAFVNTSNPLPVGTNHHAPAEGELELGRDDTVIRFGNIESAEVLAERLQYVIGLLKSAPQPANHSDDNLAMASRIPEGWSILRYPDGAIQVSHDDGNSVVVRQGPEIFRIVPEAVLWALADDILKSCGQPFGNSEELSSTGLQLDGDPK